jgi:hypothetical protein
MSLDANTIINRFVELLRMYQDIGILNKEQTGFIRTIFEKTVEFHQKLPESIIEEIRTEIVSLANTFFSNLSSHIQVSDYLTSI